VEFEKISTGRLRQGIQWERNTAELRSPVTHHSLSAVAKWTILLLLAGVGMQGYANGTVDALFVALLLLVVGIMIVSLLFPGKDPEKRAFLLTYGVCMFVGGLAQCYSLAVFDNPQSTIDAFTYLKLISPQPPFTTMANMGLVNAPLAVLTWQQVYKLTWVLGFKFGPYTGVMFNAFVMGITGSITVRTARELFGNDMWRLKRVGLLFALCGLFALFGAVLLRDGYTTFFNSLVLWVIVRWLVQPSLRNLFFALVISGVSAYAMAFLRSEAVLLFGMYGLLVLSIWVFKRFDISRLLALLFALFVIFSAGTSIASYLQVSINTQTREMVSYAKLGSKTHDADSLGMRFVVNQPLPIRLIMGSGTLAINPIPLWAGLKEGASDYTLIKAYHGIFQVLVLPLVFAGFLTGLRLLRRDRNQAAPLIFLVMYLLLNLAAVVLTSLETRHIGQFLPAFIILAAVPNTQEKRAQKELGMITWWWFAVVVLVHLTWAVIKG